MRYSDLNGMAGPGRLKVGYVLKRFPRLSETFVINEILELERQGVEVEIFSLRRAKEELRHDLIGQLRARVTCLADVKTSPEQDTTPAARGRVDLARLMPGKSASDAMRLEAKARVIADQAMAQGLTHLHAHFASDATTAALLAGRMSGLPFSFTAHARDIFHCYVSPEIDDAARRLKIGEARFVATVSDFNKRYLDRLAGNTGAGNVVRLYNGIDLDRFAPPSQPKRAWGRILSVGRLVEKKGLEDLVEACRLLRDRGADFRCEIVGEGPLRSVLEDRISSSGLEGSVMLLGAQTHERVRASMRHSNLFVLPCIVSASGDRDGLPTVLLEALASGLPAISTDIAGIPEIVQHGRTGLLVEPSAPAELAGAMKRLLADQRLAARLARGGRQHAIENFDLRANVAVLARLFEGWRPAQTSSTQRTEDAHRLSVG